MGQTPGSGGWLRRPTVKFTDNPRVITERSLTVLEGTGFSSCAYRECRSSAACGAAVEGPEIRSACEMLSVSATATE